MSGWVRWLALALALRLPRSNNWVWSQGGMWGS